VLVLGVDRLREIADALGPPAAEQLLAAMASRLDHLLPPGAELTPLLADAFALTLVEPTAREEIIELAERLLTAAAAPLTVCDEELRVSVSVGVAFTGTGSASTAALAHAAATAQHRAQERGGGCVELFAPRQSDGLLDSLRLENDLRGVLAGGEGLKLFFQPIIELASGELLAVEALVRWDHPTRGLLLPGRFLPLAERTGLLSQVEQWVIGEACRQLASWADPPRVSVNVSAAALAAEQFVANLARELRGNSLDPRRLILELDESALLASGSATRVHELRALGVAVLLDDVGHGYSWLPHVGRLQLDGVKIERSIVEQPAAAAITTAIESVIGAARTLGLTVVAKDVETRQQLERAQALGATAAQGLHFLAPVPAGTLLDVLALSPPAAIDVADATALAPGAPSPGAERAVTLGQAASLLGISASTLRRWAADGRVTAVRTSGGHRRFYVSELARVNTPAQTKLRLPDLPEGPLANLASVIASDGVELASIVARSLYSDRPGWFAREEALPPLRGWLSALALAFQEGDYDQLADSLRAFTLAATVGGSTLTERHMFLERFGALLETRLTRNGCHYSEVNVARRTMSALTLQQLSDCTEQSTTPRLPARRRRAARAHSAERGAPRG
jgi:excisionase family DNA binding protein